MSSRELIESLRRAAEESSHVVKREAEKEAAALQAAAAQKIADLQKQCAERLAAVSGDELRRAHAEASNRARAFRLTAEKTLADSLYSIARFSLHQLRDDHYPAVFEKLVRELPALPWKIVRVHAADIDLARKYFPDAQILPVGHISGGVDVTVADGSIEVINTFEKRLERLWTDLLPQMVNDVYREVADGPSL
ncbi:MAG TPA: V-type ATP synthase subunit E [Nitrospirota bacterium]|nr:V-type ATP synthase subunit E [Nitrospirota bacterium]